jgi:Na+/melibiose symporter-like transporter
MSVVRMGRIGAIMLVTPIAGWALDHLGYQILFPLGGLLGLASTFFFTQLTVNEGVLPARETKALSELWQIAREDRPFARYLRSFALYGTGTLISWTIYPLVQVDRLHLSYSQLGLLGFVQSIFWLGGYFFWGRLVDHRGGLYVLRMTCLIAVIAPASYLLASAGWMLLPAFAAQGLVNSGWDMGMINAGIQLAPSNQVVEYAAIQSTVVGIRGMIVPLVAVGLLRLGIPDTGIFALSMLLMVTAWVMFGSVQAPTPPPGPETRYHWPIRFRWPLS